MWTVDGGQSLVPDPLLLFLFLMGVVVYGFARFGAHD